jgi:hypothetical protein
MSLLILGTNESGPSAPRSGLEMQCAAVKISHGSSTVAVHMLKDQSWAAGALKAVQSALCKAF